MLPNLLQQRRENTASYKEFYVILLYSNLPPWMQLVLQRRRRFPTQAEPARPRCTRQYRREKPRSSKRETSQHFLAEEEGTCLQQKRQGPAAHRKPHDLSEAGVLPAHQLHSELESCLK